MDLTPLIQAPVSIQVHACAALTALALGVVMLVRPKGTPSHKLIGRIWVAIMVVVALSSFLIHELRQIGGFSLIHLLSVLTLAAMPYAVWQIRRGNVRAHRTAMVCVFVGGPVVAGLFTLMPTRIMHAVFFGP